MFQDLRVKINLGWLGQMKSRISQAQHILLVTHRNPDADAIGSLTAMMYYMDNLNKDYTAFCYDVVPTNLEYLYGSDKIVSNQKIFKGAKYDLIIILDCGALSYTGINNYLDSLKNQKNIFLINIDHHFSNYGDINLVDSRASATAVILYEVFRFWGVKINKILATSLLTGILVDTGNFGNSGTTVASLEISAELIRLGARFGQIGRQVYRNKTLSALNLWSKLLSRLQKNVKLKIVYTVILLEDLKDVNKTDLDGVANFFNYLDEARLTMILKETPGNEIKVSLRTSDDQINLERVAKFFGGGGHIKAAGFIVKGRLEFGPSGWKII